MSILPLLFVGIQINRIYILYIWKFIYNRWCVPIKWSKFCVSFDRVTCSCCNVHSCKVPTEYGSNYTRSTSTSPQWPDSPWSEQTTDWGQIHGSNAPSMASFTSTAFRQKWKIIYWLKRKSFPCVCGSTSLGYATVIIFPIFTTEYLGTKIENIKNSNGSKLGR